MAKTFAKAATPPTSTSHAIGTMPTGTGGVLIAWIFTGTASTTFSSISGGSGTWTTENVDTTTGNFTILSSLDATDLTFTSSGPVVLSIVMVRDTDLDTGGAMETLPTFAANAGTTLNPPSQTLSAGNYVVYCGHAKREGALRDASAPSGYTFGDEQATSGIGTGDAGVTVFYKAGVTTTEDPGTYTRTGDAVVGGWEWTLAWAEAGGGGTTPRMMLLGAG